MSFIIQEIPTPTVFGIGVVEPTGAGGAISFEVGTQDELFLEGDASANFTVDVIFDPTTSLNVAMQDEDIATIHLKVKNGLTPYALEALTIDGTGSGVEIFLGGNEFFPIYGATSQVYDYAFEITKISDANFQVFVGINSDYSEGFNPPEPAFGVSASDLGNGSGATVTFTAGDLGGASGATFTVISNPSAITASGSASPINIGGLTVLDSYDFIVKTQTVAGQSFSGPSNQITIAPGPGQVEYTGTGTYSFIVPPGITSVSVLTVGDGGNGYRGGGFGGGGGGGGLGYKNNIAVTPGQSYDVKVGQALGPATGSGFFDATPTLIVAGYKGGNGSGFNGYGPGLGRAGGPGGTFLGDGGGNGGNGAPSVAASPPMFSGGGAGAGGYSGAGGNGGGASQAVTAGSGGGGGGGTSGPDRTYSGGGGGVGLLGLGPNGTAASTPQGGGGGGSGGGNGNSGTTPPNGLAGNYGGGGGGTGGGGGSTGLGGAGAVRIIYPGTTRQFPSTNTGNL